MPYTTRSITAVPRLMARTPWLETSLFPRAASNAAGISKEEMAKASNEDAVCAVWTVNLFENIVNILSY